MFYCMKCGKAIPDDYSFCPVCGERRYGAPEQPAPDCTAAIPAVPAQPPQPKVSGRARGLGIASMAVGIEGMAVSIVFAIYGLFALLLSSLDGPEFVGAFFGGFSLIFSLIALASGIVALILSIKSLAEAPKLRFASLGKSFGMAATIVAGVSLLIELIAIVM